MGVVVQEEFHLPITVTYTLMHHAVCFQSTKAEFLWDENNMED